MKDILYIDLDGVMANYDKARGVMSKEQTNYPGFFLDLELMTNGYIALATLAQYYEIYFTSTAPWSNPDAWKEKRQWVENHFGKLAYKRLILTPNKGLLKGKYLIDDRTVNGVDDFEGEHIHFGTDRFPDWVSVVLYLCPILK